MLYACVALCGCAAACTRSVLSEIKQRVCEHHHCSFSDSEEAADTCTIVPPIVRNKLLEPPGMKFGWCKSRSMNTNPMRLHVCVRTCVSLSVFHFLSFDHSLSRSLSLLPSRLSFNTELYASRCVCAHVCAFFLSFISVFLSFISQKNLFLPFILILSITLQGLSLSRSLSLPLSRLSFSCCLCLEVSLWSFAFQSLTHKRWDMSSFFLSWERIPNLITELSGWWAPNYSLRTQETVPDFCCPHLRLTGVNTVQNFCGLACTLGLTGFNNHFPLMIEYDDDPFIAP